MDEKTKFLDLLSGEINSGSNKFNFDSLNVYLTEAIKTLPDGNLKDVLLAETKGNSEYLWSLLKASKKSADLELSFSIFNKGGLEETLKSISTLKSSKEQLSSLSQVALCLPSEDIFGLLFNAEVARDANHSKLQILIDVSELCGRLTVGCTNLKVLQGLMHFFLRELGNVYEDLKLSDQLNESSWVKLKEAVLGFLIYCHIKSKRRKEDKAGSKTDWTEYRDLLAAILSLYIDVLIMINKMDYFNLDHASNLVYILLGDSPCHILDTVNQVSTFDETSTQIMLPFLRKVLCSTRSCCIGFINYIKYISTARKVLKLLKNLSNDAAAIKKIVNTVVAPDGLVTWMSDKDEGVVNELDLSGLAKKKITKHLLQFSCDETMENLLDLVAVATKDAGESFKSSLREEENDKSVEDETDSNDVFFVDAKGSSDLLEHCQEKQLTNVRSDRILKRQIDAMLEKLEATSEEEKDDFDLNFDEEERQGIISVIEQDGEKMVDSLESNTIDKGELQEDESDIKVLPEDTLDDSLNKSGGKKGRRKRKSGIESSNSGMKTGKETVEKKSKRKENETIQGK